LWRLTADGQKASRGLSATAELLVMQTGTSDSQDKAMKRSTLRVRRSKIKVTRGRRQI